MGLSEDQKTAIEAIHAGQYKKAIEILQETLQEAEKERSDRLGRLLLAEAGGRRTLKSVHGTHLRAYDREWKVDMTSGPVQSWEHWHIDEWNGKVVFKAIHSPARFLRAHPDGRVDLQDRPQNWEFWKPVMNNDGSWSFQSFHGRWLSARQDGSVTSVVNCDAWEHFWLGRW